MWWYYERWCYNATNVDVTMLRMYVAVLLCCCVTVLLCCCAAVLLCQVFRTFGRNSQCPVDIPYVQSIFPMSSRYIPNVRPEYRTFDEKFERSAGIPNGQANRGLGPHGPRPTTASVPHCPDRGADRTRECPSPRIPVTYIYRWIPLLASSKLIYVSSDNLKIEEKPMENDQKRRWLANRC